MSSDKSSGGNKSFILAPFIYPSIHMNNISVLLNFIRGSFAHLTGG